MNREVALMSADCARVYYRYTRGVLFGIYTVEISEVGGMLCIKHAEWLIN